MLMTLISALHNLSRSVGCALLVTAGGKTLVSLFVGGEMLLYLVFKLARGEVFKLARGDFMWWPRVEGIVGIMMSIVSRIIVKAIADFTGCLHLHHPFELGKPGARHSERVTASAIPRAQTTRLTTIFPLFLLHVPARMKVAWPSF